MAGGPVWNARRWPEALLWTAAAMIVGGAHVGAAAWLLAEDPVVMADNAPPTAIMIDLADEAQAAETDITDIAPDQEDGEESTPSTPVDAPQEPAPDEPVPDEPVPDAAVEKPVEEPAPPEKVVEDTPVEEMTETPEDPVAPVADAAVPLPMARPTPPPREKTEKPPEKKKPEKKEVRKRAQPQAAASQAKKKARAQVRKSERTAARQSSSGGLFSPSPAKWQSRLLAHLQRKKRYPSGARSRREEGTAYVRFSIDTAGNVLSVRLAASSGFPELDAEVVALVKRASPVPAPPPGVSRTLTVPVQFDVR